MTVTFLGAEGEPSSLSVQMDSIGVRITNEYGNLLIHWEDWPQTMERVADEVARFRKAEEAANG
jgi:hypothetical protein